MKAMITGFVALGLLALATPALAAQGQIVDIDPSGVAQIVDLDTGERVTALLTVASAIFGDPDFDTGMVVSYSTICTARGACFAADVLQCAVGEVCDGADNDCDGVR